MFLMFLLPSDATEIGKFMEHFLCANMSKFINRLNVFYQKQPAQIRKVLTCLKELADEEDVKIEKIRNKIVPLLKGNQLLVDWFLQCLGNDTGENSYAKDEYETISFRKATDSIDDDCEAYEHIPQSEIFPDPNDNPCHIRYMNGRLYYGHRLSFPAKLSFSTVNTNVSRSSDTKQSNADNGKEATATTTPPAATCTSYRCVHDIKESVKIPAKTRNTTDVDPTDNGTAEEVDDSDDEQQIDVKFNLADEKLNTETNSSHLLCDDKILKAHGIRLNPMARSSVTHSSVEILNMLKSSDHNADGHRECKLSPKKQTMKPTATTTHAKLPRKYSPNSKKATSAGNLLSPNRKQASPPTSTPMHTIVAKPTNESPAIQTAKKLRKMLETSQVANDKSDNAIATSLSTSAAAAPNTVKRGLPSTSAIANKVRKVNRIPDQSMTPSKAKPTRHVAEKIDEQQARSDETSSRCKQTDLIEEDKHKSAPTPNAPITWSRDEDRLLLEHIKNGLESNHELITQITHEFPTKTTENIEERIDFLIDFLTKLRNIT